MSKDRTSDLHQSLNLAGFRALATAAGLIQLCRELDAAGVLQPAAIGRIQDAIFTELMTQVGRSRRGDNQFAMQLRKRLEALFSGAESLNDEHVVPLS